MKIETLNSEQVDMLIDEFISEGVDEDRLEYSVFDFQQSQLIDETSAKMLQRRLHERSGLIEIYNEF